MRYEMQQHHAVTTAIISTSFKRVIPASIFRIAIIIQEQIDKTIKCDCD
jgi:hypothetical protein